MTLCSFPVQPTDASTVLLSISPCIQWSQKWISVQRHVGNGLSKLFIYNIFEGLNTHILIQTLNANLATLNRDAS